MKPDIKGALSKSVGKWAVVGLHHGSTIDGQVERVSSTHTCLLRRADTGIERVRVRTDFIRIIDRIEKLSTHIPSTGVCQEWIIP